MDLSSNFEELMQRSPISQHDMKAFLREMRRTPSGTVTVSKLLATKLQSSSEAQAIHAFEFLECALESESEGSIEFRTEIGRYRFLNEIIRILSPKYLADSTPEPVKERAIKFLEDAAGAKRRRWFPSEHSKINSVYQSLIDGGIIHKPQRAADEDAEFQKSIFERGENALILKRLLQSKDPSDLQAANRLIKNLVDEETRRNERRAELHSLIDRIETSTGLLTEMLCQNNIDKEIVEELVETCRSLRQKLGGVATETNDEATSLLQASENIETVLMLYESKKDSIGKTVNNERESTITESNSSVPNAGAASLSLADELLMNLDEQLNDRPRLSKSQEKGSYKNYTCGDNLLNLDIDLGSTTTVPNTLKYASDANQSQGTKAEELFGEISKINKEMMEEGLKGVPNSSKIKKTDKTPLCQIKKQSPSHEVVPETQSQLIVNVSTPAQPPVVPAENIVIDPMSNLDLDFLDKPLKSHQEHTISSGNLQAEITSTSLKSVVPGLGSSEDDNLLLLDLENGKFPQNNKNKTNSSSNGPFTKESNSKKLSPEEVGNNSEPRFCLNSVRELDLESIDLLDDLKPMELNLEESCKDVSLTLTFGKYPDFPKQVNIAVITLTNRNKGNGLLNYVFQLLPPKGLQVKLLPPECMELPPWKKAFLPPPILTQVALISQLNSVIKEKQPKIKYILSYCVEEETILHNGDFSLPSCLLQ